MYYEHCIFASWFITLDLSNGISIKTNKLINKQTNEKRKLILFTTIIAMAVWFNLISNRRTQKNFVATNLNQIWKWKTSYVFLSSFTQLSIGCGITELCLNLRSFHYFFFYLPGGWFFFVFSSVCVCLGYLLNLKTEIFAHIEDYRNAARSGKEYCSIDDCRRSYIPFKMFSLYVCAKS